MAAGRIGDWGEIAGRGEELKRSRWYIRSKSRLGMCAVMRNDDVF